MEKQKTNTANTPNSFGVMKLPKGYYLTVKAYCEMRSVSVRTVNSQISAGIFKLPTFHFPGVGNLIKLK